MANISNTSPRKKFGIADITGLQSRLEEIVAQGVQLVDNLTSTDTDKALTANQGKVLKDLIDGVKTTVQGIQTTLTSDDVNLDTLQEIVTKIKEVDNVLGGVSAVMDTKKQEAITAAQQALDAAKQTLQTAIDSKVAKTDIVDNLVDGGTDKVLSAEQGKVLKGLIDGKTNTVVNNTLTSDSTTEALSAAQGKALDGKITNVTEKVEMFDTVTKHFYLDLNDEKTKVLQNEFITNESAVDYTCLYGDPNGHVLFRVAAHEVHFESSENETGRFIVYVTKPLA